MIKRHKELSRTKETQDLSGIDSRDCEVSDRKNLKQILTPISGMTCFLFFILANELDEEQHQDLQRVYIFFHLHKQFYL